MEIQSGRSPYCTHCGVEKKEGNTRVQKSNSKTSEYYIFHSICLHCERKKVRQQQRNIRAKTKNVNILETESRAVWTDEEKEMADIARMANDPSVYINYLYCKANKATV
jgi:hypothetical protein